MNNEKVSVIIPVYNGEDTINECVESVLSQSYPNIEIIIINDGSTDGTEKELNHIAKKDKRIRVFSQTNKGILETRIIGMSMAQGEYILFVDSDDMLEKGALEKLVKFCDSDTDIVRGNYKVLANDSRKTVKDYKRYKPYNILDKKDKECFFRDVLKTKKFNTVTHELIRNKKQAIPLPKKRLSMGDDFLINIYLYNNARVIKTVPDDIYIYRADNNSTTRTSEPEKMARNAHDITNIYWLARSIVSDLKNKRIETLYYQRCLKEQTNYLNKLAQKSCQDNRFAKKTFAEVYNSEMTQIARKKVRPQYLLRYRTSLQILAFYYGNYESFCRFARVRQLLGI